MSLDNYKRDILPNKLYKLQPISISQNDIINYSMEVLGGAVDVYGSYAETPPPSPPIDMSLDRLNFTGIDSFGDLPTYIYLDGSATRITLNFIEPNEVI
jgi:hypothetical protein